VSFHDHKSFERALAEAEARTKQPPPVLAPTPATGRPLPRWLVDPDFDAAMQRDAHAVVPDDERLPLRTRAAILAVLVVAAWVPIAACAALIWS
jgi:hypothetical protein